MLYQCEQYGTSQCEVKCLWHSCISKRTLRLEIILIFVNLDINEPFVDRPGQLYTALEIVFC